MKVPELVQLCKDRGVVGYSGLSKAGVIFLLKNGRKPGTKDGVFKEDTALFARTACREKREQATATGSDAYKGYSSLNKAGLTHMLKNDGAKPTLKDGTFTKGTVGRTARSRRAPSAGSSRSAARRA
jgi:hypothetical protein